MRAVVFERTLAFHEDYPDPRPGENECLVRVHLAGICSTDLQLTEGYMSFRGVLGHEMVGTVVSGPAAWRDKRVACEINCVCRTCDMCQAGLASHCRKRTVLGIDGRDGCFADLVAVPQRNFHLVPDTISDEEAVFIEPLAAAYQVLAQCPIDEHMTAMVLGSGRLGLLVAQVLRDTKCKLTVVGRNPGKLLRCEKKGIQTIHLNELIPRNDQDVVVDCTGSADGLKLAMELVRPRGTIILKTTCVDPGQVNLAPLVIDEVRLLGSRCGPFPEAINALARQAVEVRSMISRTYPISEAAAAFHAAGQSENLKILLKVNPRPSR